MSSNSQTNLSNILVTLTTLIFAVSSMITVIISLSAWKEERESVRPYLTLSSPVIAFENDSLLFSFELCNVGLNPAASLHCQTTFLDCNPDSPLLHEDQYSMSNIISRNAGEKLTIKIDSNSSAFMARNIYLVISLKYTDPVLEREHEQIMYFKWPGMEDGKPAHVYHASKDDRELILNYLRKN